MITIATQFPDGTHPVSLLVTYMGAGMTKAVTELLDTHGLNIEDDLLPLSFIRIVPEGTGYWSYFAFHVSADLEITFSPLPQDGPLGWWHYVHGVSESDLSRGKGVTIGIIDEALEEQSATSCIRGVINLGIPGQQNDRAYKPRVDHGQAVTSLVASTCSQARGYQGIAPGAKAYFAAAGSDKSERLSSGRVANAIDQLVNHYECNFITVSAGDVDVPLPEIQSTLQDAWDSGVLCFFASGNRADAEILYPARYDECLSVAALGLRGFAPNHTEECQHDITSTFEVFPNLYQWKSSSVLGVADFIAAGSNVIWTLENKAKAAANGTSFASPIAAGAAAVICSRDETYLSLGRNAARSRHALSLLEKRSVGRYILPQNGHEKGAGIKYGIIRV